jgi:hypothetical protein
MKLHRDTFFYLQPTEAQNEAMERCRHAFHILRTNSIATFRMARTRPTFSGNCALGRCG